MDQPFTNSFATDIVLLSSSLSNQTRIDDWDFLDKANTRHVLLNYISTILNVGIVPNGENAILGLVDSKLIKCIVFTETSASPQKFLNLFPSFQQHPENYSLQKISSSYKRGAELLKNWAQDEWSVLPEIYENVELMKPFQPRFF